jgi:hypothetical protein
VQCSVECYYLSTKNVIQNSNMINSLKIEIAGSNPARGMDVCVCACFCVVLSCVSVEALRWTDPPTKESYQISVDREVH